MKDRSIVDLNGVSTDIVLSKTGQSTETNPSLQQTLSLIEHMNYMKFMPNLVMK